MIPGRAKRGMKGDPVRWCRALRRLSSHGKDAGRPLTSVFWHKNKAPVKHPRENDPGGALAAEPWQDLPERGTLQGCFMFLVIPSSLGAAPCRPSLACSFSITTGCGRVGCGHLGVMHSGEAVPCCCRCQCSKL